MIALGSLDLAAALDVEVNRVAVPPPEPVEAGSFDRNVGNHYVFHHAAVEHHERQAAIRVGNDDVVDCDSAHCVGIAIAELQRAGGRGESAVGHGHVFGRQRRAPDIRRPKDDRVVARLYGGVGYAHVLAAIRVDAVCPNTFLGA